jgi:AhpD family alkylhydroperoxidase
MPQRIFIQEVAPEALKGLFATEQYARQSSIEPALHLLVKLSASYLNGCAYCVDMHSKDLRAGGESEQRLYALPVWRETPFFSDRERAALDWTEAVTELGRAGVPEAAFLAARRHFSERELVDLTVAVIAINSWNRLTASLGADVGSYQAKAAKLSA